MKNNRVKWISRFVNGGMFRIRHFARLAKISIGASLVLGIYLLSFLNSPPELKLGKSIVLKPPTRDDDTLNMNLDRGEVPERYIPKRKKLAPKEEEQPACHLPALKPFDPSILQFDTNPEPIDCTEGHPLLFKADFESHLVQVGDPKEFGFSSCCYQSFQRPFSGTDKNITIAPECIPIETRKVRIREDIDFVRVSCEKTFSNGTRASVPVDYLGFVHLKPDVEARVKGIENGMEGKGSSGGSGGPQERKVNVVILGMDSVSHMNFQRVMPKTRDYLVRNLSAFYLDGYNREAVMTFVNLVPALMGVPSVEVYRKMHCPREQYEDCPFVWKNFSARGYRTVYGEDAVWQGIFVYYSQGFNKTPTDYYYNGLMHQLEENLGHKCVSYPVTKFCYGPRPAFDISLDYLQKMAVTMNRTRRYFQFMWTGAMTHDSLTHGKLGDQPLLETLKWFKDEGYLEDTVFILMSDHGTRYGEITKTVQGKYEVNMPLVYLILPEWFREKYGTAVGNLLRNRNRLTTHYDLHETLLDLSNLESISEERLKERGEELKKPKLPRGMSLFLPIPLGRTCDDARIEDQFFTCLRLRPVKLEGNTLVQEGARHVVQVINEMFVKYPECSPLVLDNILNAQVLEPNNDSEIANVSAIITRADDPRMKKERVSFSLSIIVKPSNATFEAPTARKADGTWEVSGDISRTNSYAQQSWCVTDRLLKNFCYCV